jgi:hypothetical protein
VDGRVEAAVRPLAGGERELDDGEEVGTGLDRSRGVEPRELGAVVEAGEQPLEAAELALHGGEAEDRVQAGRCLEERLDLRSHGAESVAFHQELLVDVTGGSETTPTEGGAAGADEATGAAAAALALAASIAAMARVRLRRRTS